MSEYIEREALKVMFSSDNKPLETAICSVIDAVPAADVAPVVHCRDCRKRDTPSCNMTHDMGGGRFLTCNEDLGYCNLAEMKHIEINKGEGSK